MSEWQTVVDRLTSAETRAIRIVWERFEYATRSPRLGAKEREKAIDRLEGRMEGIASMGASFDGPSEAVAFLWALRDHPEIVKSLYTEIASEIEKCFSVENPWTHETMVIYASEVIESRLAAMAALMDEEIRERLHNEIAPCSPGEFFAAYADIVGPKQAGILWFS